MDARLRLQKGDVVLTKGNGWISKLIRRYTRTGDEGPSKVNHAGIVVQAEVVRFAIIVEALGTGVKRHRLWRYHDTKNEVAIFRHKGLTKGELERVSLAAERYEGRAYGYGKIVTSWLDWLIGNRYVFRRLSRVDKFPICSWIVASAFDIVGETFGLNFKQASPDDIWDYVVAHPDMWEKIYPLSPLTEDPPTAM